jgi:branched-chain amino acid transport system permease protein
VTPAALSAATRSVLTAKGSHIVWPVLLTAAVLLALGGDRWVGPYWGLVLLSALLQGALVLSYDILGGYGGELNLGQGLFFGLGAYLSAGALAAGWPAWGATLLAAAGGLAMAAVACLLLVPLRGLLFAIASLCLLLLMGLLANNLEPLTGGSAGLSLSPQWGMWGTVQAALVLFATCWWLHERFPRSNLGRALRDCADDRQAAAAAGVAVRRVRSQALVLGALPAALAGGLYPFQAAYVSPQSAFGLETAMAPVVMVLVGGAGTRWGPLMGLLLLTALQEWLWVQGLQWRLSVWGGCLILSAVLMPRGLAGLLDGVGNLLKRPVPNTQKQPPL